MMTTKRILLLGIPAVILAFGMVFLQVKSYRSLTPKPIPQATGKITIPILPNDPIVGDNKALHTIVFFSDLLCDGCVNQAKLLEELQKRHPTAVRIVWKGLSVTRTPASSETLHAYAFCAFKQKKFTPFVQAVYDVQGLAEETIRENATSVANLDLKQLEACLANEEKDVYRAQTELIATGLRVQSVPALFLDNTPVNTPQFVEGWETLLGL